MVASKDLLRFEQLHIDIARNSTDDFNPFHDPRRWQDIQGNPFGSPIALGFQLEFLVADLIERQRRASAPSAEETVDPGLQQLRLRVRQRAVPRGTLCGHR